MSLLSPDLSSVVHVITDKSRPALAAGARLSTDKRTGEPVLLYPEGVVELSPTAHAILTQCNGQTTTEGIIVALAAEFEGDPAEIRKDVRECLSGLWRRKLIVFA